MRLTDIDALTKVAGKLWDELPDGEELSKELMKAINHAPTIEAELVVHCKDCKWWDKKHDSPYGYCHACKHGHRSEHWEINIYRIYKGDWYCADGERKDGGE